jgi:starch phosphorylase
LSHDSTRTGLSADTLQRAVGDNLIYLLARFPEVATPHDWYLALAYSVRDRMLERWAQTVQTYFARDVKVACYLSAEFLIGPQLNNNLLNLGIEASASAAMRALGQDLRALCELEEEPGLGNGGLGRLAACYLDSLAALEVPALGYGIRYEFGIFEQEIRDGAQVEVTDKYLLKGNPWEIVRPAVAYHVNLGGRTESFTDEQGRYRVRWIPASRVKGVACDIPVLGYRVNTCNTLRLWKSEAEESFDFRDFNVGDYYGAVREKVISETLSKVLYPNDEPETGKRLRLAQQYFFVSCSLQDMLRLLEMKGVAVSEFPDAWAVQMNDTHPSIAVAELMRLLVDEHLLSWDAAWEITQRALSYTNHTLLPEALETWGLPLFQELLPRPLEIIYEINRRFLDYVRRRYPGDEARVRRVSLIDETGERRVRMANLAAVGSHAINGVATLHSALLKETVLRDFAELWPERFDNVTNGVTPRRFLALCNPNLAQLLDETIGEGWARDLNRLRALESRVDDQAFRARWRAVKLANKVALARRIYARTGVEIDPRVMFDIHVKRIHEYKRQHLNVLHVITLYLRLRRNPSTAAEPRCVIFGGKAAPGYRMAKLMIRLITGVAAVVNADTAIGERLKVVFLPNFNVKNADVIYPAADLSEQISTAGSEASGTGNMKFAMNGAVTIGTLDGANIEIREQVGADNFFLFGLTSGEVGRIKREERPPQHYLDRSGDLRDALELVASGHFSRGDRELFKPLVENLVRYDPFLVLADYDDYLACQARVGEAWRDAERWTRMSILNTARSFSFSSDRAVREYCERIWHTAPVPVTLREPAGRRHPIFDAAPDTRNTSTRP